MRKVVRALIALSLMQEKGQSDQNQFTFVAFTATIKLYCLVTEAAVCIINKLPNIMFRLAWMGVELRISRVEC